MYFENVFNKIIENAKNEGMQIFFPKIVEIPRGVRQDSDIDIFDHEYVNQQAGCCGDNFYGEIYYPIGFGKYLEVGFSM